MRREPSKQLEGLVLVEDVLGKTGQPIMRKNTVLTDHHITVLQKFLVDSVVVRTGESKTALETPKNENKSIREEITLAEAEISSPTNFYDAYGQVVSQFKKEYMQWASGVPIDIAKVRKIIIPLLEQVDSLEIEPFLLQHFGDAKAYLYQHSTAVSILSAYIASKLGYEKGECLQIGIAALFSDIGMIKVDQDILLKGRPLTSKQSDEIHNHPVYSFQMIDKLPTITSKSKQAVLQHHERIDGSGYPAGLKGEEIHPYARIIAVCDTYYAMTSPRIYKQVYPIFQVLEELAKEKHKQFAGDVIHTFIDTLTQQSVGKMVKLSDDIVAEIVYIYEDVPARPLVKLEDTGDVISLQAYPNLFIERFID